MADKRVMFELSEDEGLRVMINTIMCQVNVRDRQVVAECKELADKIGEQLAAQGLDVNQRLLGIAVEGEVRRRVAETNKDNG